MLPTRQMLPTKHLLFWFSLRDTNDTFSDAKKLYGEHYCLRKKEMKHTSGWIALGN